MKRFKYLQSFSPGMNEEKNNKKENKTDKKEDLTEEDKETQITKKSILEKTAKEYFSSANDELKKKRYNSAVVLFFKALAALVDLYVYQQTGDTPSSHNDRFRITQEKFQDVYNLLDKDFPFYQDSYIQIMSKELAEVIKNDAETMAKKTQVKL